MILYAFSNNYFRILKKIRKKNIVFLNGCFDLFHLGHLKMINQVKKDFSPDYKIIVAINSNESIKLQNKSHPLINDEKDRARFLLELGIDIVIIFDEKYPTDLLKNILPDIVVKGNDYLKKDYNEKKFLTETNIDVRYYDKIEGHSSTIIYEKIKYSPTVINKEECSNG